MQSCIESVILEFKTLVADIAEQPGIQGALASDPYEEERKKLLGTLELLKDAMREIAEAGGSWASSWEAGLANLESGSAAAVALEWLRAPLSVGSTLRRSVPRKTVACSMR